MSGSPLKSRPSKGMLIAGWIVSAIPILFMLFGIVYSIVKPDAVTEGMAKYGYSADAARPIVFVEAACVLIYLIPRTSILGAILLTGYLGGATATHVRVGEVFVFPIAVGVLIWLGLVLRDPILRGLIPLRRAQG